MRRGRRRAFDTASAFTSTRSEIERHARHKGAADTEDLARWLIAWAWFNQRAKDPVGALQEAARRMGRKRLSAVDATAILDEAGQTRKRMKADELAGWLRVSYAERQALGLTRIGSFNVKRTARAELRKRRDRLAQERRRRERGACPRAEYEAASLSRVKPWLAEGISRRTWERRRRRVATPPTAVFLNAADTLATAAAAAGRGSPRRGYPCHGGASCAGRARHAEYRHARRRQTKAKS